MAFYYPAVWFAVSCAWSLPGLLRSTFGGEHVVALRVNPFGLMVWSAPADPALHAAAHSFFHSTSPFWILIPLAAVLLMGLLGSGLAWRILTGLGVVALADAGLILPFTRFRGPDHVTASLILSSLLFFVVLCFGLYLMSAGWADCGYWKRLAGLCSMAALPPLFLWFLFQLLHVFRFGNFFWMLAPPAAVAASLASLRPSRASASDAKPVGVVSILAGVAASVLLVAGIAWGGPSVAGTFQLYRQYLNQAAVAKLLPIPVNAPYPKIFFQKGVSFSAEFPDPYASAGARQMLRALHADGVNAIALIPYGGMTLGSPQVHGFGRHSWESEEGMQELSRLAHALGMKVMLKPGIWIRGGHFGGDIQFSSPTERQEWFDQYGKFIDRYAKIATKIHADLFCVGGEFVRMSTDTSQWRSIIANVRKVYPGPLTYAANFGQEFQQIKFWDALDYIGLQEYYPLPDNLSTSAMLAKVEAVQKRFHKPIIFTEVGFSSAPGANLHPWKNGAKGKVDLQLQARCYRAIFQAFYNKPWFKGMYWWKVGSNGFGGPADTSLTPWGKPAMLVVKNWYESGDKENARLSRPGSKRPQAPRQESK